MNAAGSCLGTNKHCMITFIFRIALSGDVRMCPDVFVVMRLIEVWRLTATGLHKGIKC